MATIPGDGRIVAIVQALSPGVNSIDVHTLALPTPCVTHYSESSEPPPTVIRHYRLRHLAKPGITDWAQVNGHRGPTNTVAKARRRVEHDLA